MEKLKVHSESFQVFVGCAGAALQIGLLITDYIEPDDVFFGPVYAAFALILLASARFAFLGPAQAALFFAVCGMQTADTLNPFYGLGFAAIAILVLFRRGIFSTRATIKAAVASAVGISLFAVPILLLGKGGMAWLPVSICAAIYAALVFGLARSASSLPWPRKSASSGWPNTSFAPRDSHREGQARRPLRQGISFGLRPGRVDHPQRLVLLL